MSQDRSEKIDNPDRLFDKSERSHLANPTPETVCKEANQGLGDLNKQKRDLIAFLKAGGSSGITNDFGKPSIVGKMTGDQLKSSTKASAISDSLRPAPDGVNANSESKSRSLSEMRAAHLSGTATLDGAKGVPDQQAAIKLPEAALSTPVGEANKAMETKADSNISDKPKGPNSQESIPTKPESETVKTHGLGWKSYDYKGKESGQAPGDLSSGTKKDYSVSNGTRDNLKKFLAERKAQIENQKHQLAGTESSSVDQINQYDSGSDSDFQIEPAKNLAPFKLSATYVEGSPEFEQGQQAKKDVIAEKGTALSGSVTENAHSLVPPATDSSINQVNSPSSDSDANNQEPAANQNIEASAEVSLPPSTQTHQNDSLNQEMQYGQNDVINSSEMDHESQLQNDWNSVQDGEIYSSTYGQLSYRESTACPIELYTVEKGDSLYKIAGQKLGQDAKYSEVQDYVQQIADVNKINNVNHINPGQQLELPPPDAPKGSLTHKDENVEEGRKVTMAASVKLSFTNQTTGMKEVHRYIDPQYNLPVGDSEPPNDDWTPCYDASEAFSKEDLKLRQDIYRAAKEFEYYKKHSNSYTTDGLSSMCGGSALSEVTERQLTQLMDAAEKYNAVKAELSASNLTPSQRKMLYEHAKTMQRLTQLHYQDLHENMEASAKANQHAADIQQGAVYIGGALASSLGPVGSGVAGTVIGAFDGFGASSRFGPKEKTAANIVAGMGSGALGAFVNYKITKNGCFNQNVSTAKDSSVFRNLARMAEDTRLDKLNGAGSVCSGVGAAVGGKLADQIQSVERSDDLK